MELSTIRKDLDEILVLNSTQYLKNKTIKKFGNNYTVFGIEPILVKQISEILVSNLDNLNIYERVELIKELVNSNIFEEVWLGYLVWINSKKSSLGLNRNEILSLRPKTKGLFSHLYATKILPPYIRIGKFSHTILYDLIDNGNLNDQIISLRTYLTIAKKSTKFRKFSSQMLENRKWIDDPEISNQLLHLNRNKRYRITNRSNIHSYAQAV